MDASDLLENLQTLRRLARRLVDDEAEANDVASAAVEAIGSGGGRIRDLRGYAAGVVRFQALKVRRAAARRRHHEQAVAAERPTEAPSADDFVARRELMTVVLREIGTLPERQSRAITLRYLEQLSVQEIAEREGLAPGTVRSHISRGLATLRERLDRESGSRAAWSSVLAPWALDPADLAGSAAEGARASASATAGASTSTGAFLGALWTMTALKTTLILSIGAATAAGAWLALSDDDPGAMGAGADLVALPAERAGIADTAAANSDDAAPRLTTTNASREAAAPAAEGSEAEPSAAPTPPFEGRLIELATGRPVPGAIVEVRPEGGSRSDAVRTRPTKPDGTFRSGLALPARTVRLRVTEGVGLRPMAELPEPVVFPLEQDLAVDVEPAIRFRFSGLPAHISQACSVSPTAGPIQYARTQDRGEPWARFSDPLPAATPALKLTANDGFHFAIAELPENVTDPRTRFAAPLLAEFIAGGTVRLRTSESMLERSANVILRPLDDPDGATIRSKFRRPEKGGDLVADEDHVAPGRYEWSVALGSFERRGELEVLPLQVTELRIEEVDSTWMAATVPLDARAVPEVDMGKVSFFLVDEDDPTRGRGVEARRVAGGEPGQWEIVVDDVPDGKWMIGFGQKDDLAFDQLLVRLESGKTTDPVVVTRALPPAAATVRVVDAATGDPIEDVRLWVAAGIIGGPAKTSATGVFEGVELAAGEEVSLIARADGYGIAQLDLGKTTREEEIEIRLERGWRGRVQIFDMTSTSFAEGVSVHADGKLVGHTDARGIVWLEGEGPPERVRVGVGDDSIEVIVDPYELGRSGPSDAPGQIFAIRRK